MIYWISFLCFVLSLSSDTFIAGISIGTSKIKISFSFILLMSFVNTIILTFSCFLGKKIQFLFPNYWITILSALPFFILGFYKIFNKNSTKSSLQEKRFTSETKYIFQIFKDPNKANKADLDFSKKISIKELILLTVSLSIDNLAAGLGLGMTTYPLYMIIFFNFVFNFLFFTLGNCLFYRLATDKINWSLSSGIGFIFIGIYRLFY